MEVLDESESELSWVISDKEDQQKKVRTEIPVRKPTRWTY